METSVRATRVARRQSLGREDTLRLSVLHFATMSGPKSSSMAVNGGLLWDVRIASILSSKQERIS